MLWSPVYLKRRLSRPLPTKNGGILSTVKDVRTYVLALARQPIRAPIGSAPANSSSIRQMSRLSASESSRHCSATPSSTLEAMDTA